MAKKKSSADPRLDTQPLHFGMMSRDQQAAVSHRFEAHTGGLRTRTDETITNLSRQRSRAKPTQAITLGHRIKRLQSVRDLMPTKPVSIDQAADNRIGWMKRAATTERMPHESMGGAGWYYGHHERVRAAVPDVPMHVAGTASPLASPGTRPDAEVGTVRAVHQADMGGTIHMHPEVVMHLASKGVDVPRGFQGKTIPFRQLPTEALQHLVDPHVRSMTSVHSQGVDWTGMGGTAHPRNVSAVGRTLRGEVEPEKAISHTTAPKLSGYSKNTIESVPGTSEEMEYHSRAAHLGEVLRGETASNTPVKFSGVHPVTGQRFADEYEGHASQHMLDLYGKRGSTEGQLGHGHTAEDSWMQAASVSIPDEKRMKAVGDVPFKGGKKATLRSGRVVSASADSRVGGTAVYHAAQNEATRRAAVKLEQQHGLEYRVPTTLVQETTWTGARRAAGEDPEFNAHVRATNASETTPRRGRQPKQLDLWGRGEETGKVSKPLNAAQFGDEPTGQDRVKEEAKSAAIQRNIRKKRGMPTYKELGNEPYEGWA